MVVRSSMAVIGAAAWQWAVVRLAIAVAVAGFGLVAINVVAIVRPRRAGEAGPPRPLIGRPRQLTRRAFFRRLLGTGFGFAMLGGFGLSSLAMLWPELGGGFGDKITLSEDLEKIREQIRSERQPFYFAPGHFYLVEYDPADDRAAIYGEQLLDGGLMALYQRCVHLGCRVPFCLSSQWFECPCHGSKYNRAGEYRAGPAPRGLDRFPLSIEGSKVTVDTSIIITGPPRGTDTTGQNPLGAFRAEIRAD